METTLVKILKHDPCGQDPEDVEGWCKLLNYLGKTKQDHEPLSILTILKSNGLDDALWALRCVAGYDRELRLFACWCACQSLYIFEKKCPWDMRPRQAIETAALYSEGLATAAAMAAAWDTAWNTAWDGAWDTTSAAARAAASAAARATASAAAWAAAWDGARAATWAATSAAARATASAAARVAQKEELIQMITLEHDYMPLV